MNSPSSSYPPESNHGDTHSFDEPLPADPLPEDIPESSPSSEELSSHDPLIQKRTLRSLLSDPLSVGLIVITVVSLVLSSLMVAELVGRYIGAHKVARSAECVVHDSARAVFQTSPPFLWQHITHSYPVIHIHTGGNQVKEAKKMTADITISDVSLVEHDNARGVIGSLYAQLTWPSEGIEETIQSLIPVFGSAISDVQTDPAQGTIKLDATLTTIIVKPSVNEGKISLKMVKLAGLGSVVLPKDLIQPALDRFAQDLVSRYPLGLHAKTLKVTDTGITAEFIAHNSPIPLANDPCFAYL